MKHLRVMTDNSTAISYLRRQGGVRSMLCNNVTTEIWEFCIKGAYYQLHIFRGRNISSREFQDSHEWMLSLEVFKYLVKLFQLPDIDMFAPRLNKQLPKYASWLPDPE